MANENPDDPLNPYHAKVLRFVTPSGNSTEEIDEQNFFRLLVNIGTEDEVEIGERVIVFELGDQIKDPDTDELLGKFEIVKGEGKVVSAQARMAIIRSDRTKFERRPKAVSPFALATGIEREYENVSVPVGFRNPKIGDLVRFI